MTGCELRYDLHVCLEFREYVQTHKEHDNEMHNWTVGAICFRPTSKQQVDIGPWILSLGHASPGIDGQPCSCQKRLSYESDSLGLPRICLKLSPLWIDTLRRSRTTLTILVTVPMMAHMPQMKMRMMTPPWTMMIMTPKAPMTMMTMTMMMIQMVMTATVWLTTIMQMMMRVSMEHPTPT